MSSLTILNNSIRTLDTLYSLNDLHRASGAEAKHQPNRFMRLDATQELVAEIDNSQTPDLAFGKISQKLIRGGADLTIRGYWVCEELALAYATWISPKFHLVVLRAFIAMHRGEQLQYSQPNLPLAVQQDEEALEIIVNLCHHLNGAYEFGKALREKESAIAEKIEKVMGGHYLYNLNFPTKFHLDKAKQYIQAKNERVSYVKNLLNLLA